MQMNRLHAALILVILAGASFSAPRAVAGKAPDESEVHALAGLVREYCESYLGYKTAISSPKELQFWYGADGKVAQAKCSARNGAGDLGWQLIYWNNLYAIDLTWIDRHTSSSDLNFACIAFDFNFPLTFTSIDLELLGRHGGSLQSFSELVEDRTSELSVEDTKFLGKSYKTLRVKTAQFGEIEFAVSDNRIEFIGITRSPEVLRRTREGLDPYGKVDGWEKTRVVCGPISYDRKGKPIACKRVSEVDYENKPSEVVELAELRIASYEIEKPGISSERIDFEEFGIPKQLSVLCDSPLPYELRDGRLVKLVDMRAEEIAQTSAFRKSSLLAKWPMVILVLFSVGSISLYWRAQKK